MSDLREIFLQPECCADEHSGRLWCEDDAPVDCEDDDGNEIPWTRYVRADLHDSLAAENAALKAQAYSDVIMRLWDVLKEAGVKQQGDVVNTVREALAKRAADQPEAAVK